MAIRKRDHFRDDQPENIQRRKLISILALVFLILVFALISYFVGVPLVRQFTDSPETFRDYIDDKGFFGQLLMIGIVALQVVLALLPGEPFEVGAGFIFGWVEGAILCLIGMAAASFPGSTVAVVENKLLDALATYLDEAKTDLGGLR